MTDGRTIARSLTVAPGALVRLITPDFRGRGGEFRFTALAAGESYRHVVSSIRWRPMGTNGHQVVELSTVCGLYAVEPPTDDVRAPAEPGAPAPGVVSCPSCWRKLISSCVGGWQGVTLPDATGPCPFPAGHVGAPDDLGRVRRRRGALPGGATTGAPRVKVRCEACRWQTKRIAGDCCHPVPCRPLAPHDCQARYGACPKCGGLLLPRCLVQQQPAAPAPAETLELLPLEGTR